MNSFLFLTIVAASHFSDVKQLAPLPGALLLTVQNVNSRDRAAFIASSGQLKRAPTPTAGALISINWGRDTSEIMIQACSDEKGVEARCHIERMSIAGELRQTYPSTLGTNFIEADGRVTAGNVTGPARISADGELLVLGAYERQPAFLDAATGQFLSGMNVGHCEYAWSPEGHVLAYTRSPSTEHTTLTSSQLFLLDFDTGIETQLTFFPDVDVRPWWDFWSNPHTLPAMVAGISWARKANTVLFFARRSGGTYLWNATSRATVRIPDPSSTCWRRTQLSTDGQQILFISSSTAMGCLLNVDDEVRITRVDESSNDTLLRATGDTTIYDIDWWTD